MTAALPEVGVVAFARRYRELGFHLLALWGVTDGVCHCPLGQDCGDNAGKHPRFPWKEAPSVEPRHWLQHPEDNIGIATGSRSKLFVLDVDCAEGKQGRQSLEELEAKHQPLPATVRIQTGTGLHFYFRYQDGLRNTAGVLGAHLDTRGEGGYVVAPPSHHRSGKNYLRVVGHGFGEAELQDVPEWLTSLLLQAPTPELPPRPSWTTTSDRAARYAQEALSRSVLTLARAPKGERNNALNAIAYSLGRLSAGIGEPPEDVARSALIGAVVAAGLKPREAHQTFASGWAAGLQEPKVPQVRDTVSPNSPTPPVQKDEAAGQTWEEFCRAAEKDDALPWVLKPFLPPHGIVVVAGEQKSGKTLWLSWVVGQVLAAELRVLFVELEGSRSMLRDRLRLFAPPNMSGLAVRFRMKDTITAEGTLRLLEAAQKHQADLIVIDPLFRAMAGDENDSTVMRQVVENLEALTLAANCPVAVLHHVRKAPKEGRDLLTSADVRGSGGLLSAASVVAMVQKHEKPGAKQVRFDVICSDSWYEAFPTQRCLVTFDKPGQPLELLPDESDKRFQLRGTVRIALLKALSDAAPHSLTTRALIQAGKRAGVGQDTVMAELNGLLEAAQVVRVAGPRSSFNYRLPRLLEPVEETVPERTGYGQVQSGAVDLEPTGQPTVPDCTSPPLGGVQFGVRYGARENLTVPHRDESPGSVPASDPGCLAMVNGRPCGSPTTLHCWCEKHPFGVVP